MADINKQEKSYFDRIKFDPKLTIGLVASWVTNIRVVILMVIAIVFLGLASYFNIPRRLNPEIKIPIVSVTTILPGASPEDIESLITIPLETQIGGVVGIDTLSSSSMNNVSAIVIQFQSQINSDKAKQDVQSVVEQFTDLPKDAQTPKVQAFDFENQPFWTFTVSGSDVASLMRFSDTLKRNIESITKVDHVSLFGYEDRQISVRLNPQKINQYSINPLTISALLGSGITSFPAGSVATNRNDFALTIDPAILTVADIRAIRLNLNGSLINLGEIADISETSKNDIPNSYIADNKNSADRTVTFNIYKTTNANFDEVDKLVRQIVDSTNTQFDNRFKVTTIINYADEISKQFKELLGEFRSTILLVMGCLFIFLGLRQALISSVTVPLTFLSAFIFVKFFGMSINFLSLFAFLIALGLLVDDTIVTVQAMTAYYQTGKFTPTQTGLIVWRDLIVPIWSTTITTIWSFIPLLLSTGIIGEFIKPIPIVVTVTMLSSTAIACLITLPFMIILLKPNVPHRVAILLKVIIAIAVIALGFFLFGKNPLFIFIIIASVMLVFVFSVVRQPLLNSIRGWIRKNVLFLEIAKAFTHYANHGVLDIDVLSRKYYWLIQKIIASKSARKKVVVAIILYALWAFSLLPMGLVRNEFFPKTDEDLVYVTLEEPSGTNLATLSAKTGEIVDKLRHIPEAQFIVANTGAGVSDMGSANATSNQSLFTVHLLDKKNRHRTSSVIAEDIRNNFSGYTDGKISVIELSSGPPAGSDLQIKLLGDDLTQLDSYANKIVDFLNKSAGVTNVQKSINPGTSKLVFVPDPEKVARAGVTTDAVGLWLRTFASGFTLGNVKFDKSARIKTDVVFSYNNGAETPKDLGNIMIPTPGGQVPLLSLGSLITKTNPTVITREDNKRTISVSGSTKKGYSASTKNQELIAFVKSLNMETGYSYKTGGINDENAKSVQSILQAMGLAFILILVTMVIQFKSYRQAAIVLMVIPLAVSSVFVAFGLTNTPLSFPALIGILSLFGIVVTNSMFIVDKINLNLKQNMPFNDAIADAGASRLEPIILTKLCTVFGLLPITLSNPLWQGLGGAIISGLLIASTIMLLFIPVVYYDWFAKEYRK
jgi:multidrug efflux pump subunit AcrB